MLFNSSLFILIFLPLALCAFYLASGRRFARLGVLCVASLAFYGYWDVRFLPLLVGSVVANWLLVQLFGRNRARLLPLVGVALNLAVLGVFKYADFVVGNLAELAGQSHGGFNIVLPIGISFFTFQQISYLVDLQRGEKRVYCFVEYAAFVMFFPQLIAGPIVRHHEIIGQFDLPPARGAEFYENMSRGSVLFAIGLLKKVAIADQLGQIGDPLFGRAAAGDLLNLTEAWAADLAFTLQIYFDFSGYSDMAIGLALMFGYRLPINFDAPYRSASIREFWRRWHMTLSRFLRDYVYIALGGNRRGRVRQAVYLLVTMLLGGLWHGAAWTFVLWGGLHGGALAINTVWDRLGLPMPRFLGWLLTILFVMFTWVLFRAEDFETAWRMMASMTGFYGVGAVVSDNLWLLAVASTVALLAPTSQRIVFARLRPNRWTAPVIAAAFVFVLLMIGGAPHDEFIYFQF